MSIVEISKNALSHNIKLFRKIIGPKTVLGVSVKANAYGHGLIESSRIMLKSGADWLCVNDIFEARLLRAAKINSPIYVMGYILKKDLEEAVMLKCRLIAYNKETVESVALAARKLKTKARLHLKIETGNYRQGIALEDILDFAKYTLKFPEIIIEGIATHFANIEDGDPDHNSYARRQMKKFKAAIETLEAGGIHIPLQHCANSAATLLFPETHFSMVRTGIAAYGLWPSKEIKAAAKAHHPSYKLMPVLSWKSRIAQIKEVPKGESVGYGRAFYAARKMKIAIIPVGYYDGYDRGFSNKSDVLIRGKPARVCGRVCMNIIMVDVTEIPDARLEDEVTLIGKDGREEITAEYLAELIGTINYEITTRISESIPRIIV